MSKNIELFITVCRLWLLVVADMITDECLQSVCWRSAHIISKCWFSYRWNGKLNTRLDTVLSNNDTNSFHISIAFSQSVCCVIKLCQVESILPDCLQKGFISITWCGSPENVKKIKNILYWFDNRVINFPHIQGGLN